jgi:hypothetical protein
MLKYMYVNHNKLKAYGVENIEKIEFSLDVDSNGYTILYSDRIVWRLDNKVIKPLIREDLYIMTMSDKCKLSFTGKLVKKPIKIISSYGYSYNRDQLDNNNKFIAKAYLAVLEIYSFSDVLTTSFIILQNNIAKFKNDILGDKLKTHITASNIKKYVTEDYDNSIFVLLADHINLKYKISELCAVYDRLHMSENLYTLTISSKKYITSDFDKLLAESLSEIVVKIKSIIVSIGEQGKKELSTIIDKY